MRTVTIAALAMLAVGASERGRAQSAPAETDPRVVKLVAAVSESRMEQLLRTLVSFGTRNTLSNPSSPTRGIGAARQWIFDELARSSPKLQVSFDPHQVPRGGRITRDVELRNVVAVLPGRSGRRIYVSGHYDTVSLGAQGQAGLNAAAGAYGSPADDADAPGANDDGSGTVLMMELARVFAESGLSFDATLVFTAVAGEEQGLIGSRQQARAARATNAPVQAVFNNDIVGGAVGGDGIVDGATVRLYSEGPEDSPSRSLAMFTRRIAARYLPSHRVRLMARRDRFGRGGDHTAWNLEGFAAVGFRESRENYSRQHNANDTIDGVSFPYLAQNARVNAAAMAVLALAPPPPVVTDERGAPMLDRRPSGYDAHLQWKASPGAAGYRVFWRQAWAPDWEHELYVGNVTDHVMAHANVDDWVFGVAAVNGDGHESTVTAYVAPPPNF
ncbi:MAG TPA: M20/M25/M40 family metallo-hydrolase [Candidatus Polarisedimenticolaceae bacterium]|nr:M20/M25/M40 family metallo-hydrolase [Candidatus Polarisedimenticolaceae bacterium]